MDVGQRRDAQAVVLLRPAGNGEALGAHPQRPRLEPETPDAEEECEDAGRDPEQPEKRRRLQGEPPSRGAAAAIAAEKTAAPGKGAAAERIDITAEGSDGFRNSRSSTRS